MMPPRLATRLLNWLLPRGVEGDTIRGDLLEEYAARADRSRSGAALWYWRTVFSVLLRYRHTPGRERQSARSSVETVAQDLRFAQRGWRRAPGFTAVVLVTLSLAIGATTAIFSALNAVLLKPLPYPNADRLVRLIGDNPLTGSGDFAVSAADFLDWRRDAQSFEQLAALATYSISMRGTTGGAYAERVAAAEEFNLAAVLGAGPAVGRDFTPADVRPDVASAAIISDGLWRRQFGANPAVIGAPLRPGRPTVVVGVLPPGLKYPDDVDLWIPASLDPARDPRNNRMYEAIGLLKRGVTRSQAQAELDTISARLDAAFPDTNRGWRVRVVPLLDSVVKGARQTLLLLLGAVGLVMLVACANVASLFVAHAQSRQREIAVRAAIGAARGRIFRQLLTESVVLSLAAGALGVVAGYWILQLLIAMGGTGIPRLEQARLDRTVLMFSVGVSIATGVLFGLLPALQMSRPSLLPALREGTSGAGTRGRARAVLVAAEVAIAVVLLLGAGLLGRSLRGLQQIDVGFKPDQLLTMRVSLSGPKYASRGSDIAFYAEASQRIKALPGVRAVGAMLYLPVGGGGFYLGRGFIRPGRPHPVEGYDAMHEILTPGTFEALGASIHRGRAFDERDTASSPRVAIINRALAERNFKGENPVGQQVLIWKDEKEPREIVGVVADLKPEDVTAPAAPEIFVPHAQAPIADMTFVVRTDGPPEALAPALRHAIHTFDPTQATYDIKPMTAVMRKALAQQRFSLALFSGFSLLALTLVAVGLYSIMAYSVTARSREMGVRIALGARPAEVRRLVVVEGLVLLAGGLALGLPAAVLGARLLRALLYGISPTDPATIAAVAGILGLVAVAAAYVPARRATRVDPVVALRGE
jgi:putative ABC transport system permease protein